MESFNQLVEIVKRLRAPGGCPWDREQTHESLTIYAVEEAHELEDAINQQDTAHIKEELGDLLFQSVLHAQIASEAGTFDVNDVLEHLNSKMISRHPHVFADVKVRDAKEVLKNWEEIKAHEKKSGANADPMAIPATFPALLRAQKIGKRANQLQFDWPNAREVLVQVTEELAELNQALADDTIPPSRDSAAQTNREEELGDLLFTIVQLARHLELDAEKCLRLANEKIVARIRQMLTRRPDFATLTMAEKEQLWQEVKTI